MGDGVYIFCALVRNQSVILTLAAKLDLVQPPAGCTLGVLAESGFMVLRRGFDFDLHLRCSIRIFPFVYRLPNAPTMSNHAVGALGRKTDVVRPPAGCSLEGRLREVFRLCDSFCFLAMSFIFDAALESTLAFGEPEPRGGTRA